jgi:hypothetical protein
MSYLKHDILMHALVKYTSPSTSCFVNVFRIEGEHT